MVARMAGHLGAGVATESIFRGSDHASHAWDVILDANYDDHVKGERETGYRQQKSVERPLDASVQTPVRERHATKIVGCYENQKVVVHDDLYDARCLNVAEVKDDDRRRLDR